MAKLAIIIAAMISINTSALTLNYKNALVGSSKDRPEISKSEFATLWDSNVAVCIKDGSKVIGINKAFATAKISKRRCSPKGAAFVGKAFNQKLVVLYAEQIAATGLLKK